MHISGDGVVVPHTNSMPFTVTLPVGTVTPNKHAVLIRQTSACLRNLWRAQQQLPSELRQVRSPCEPQHCPYHQLQGPPCVFVMAMRSALSPMVIRAWGLLTLLQWSIL